MILIPAHGSNFTAGRTKAIDRIVLHYTAGDGDSAVNNGVYFSVEDRRASAHFFVDENTMVQSVKEEDTAWHAGQWDMNCRSLGIEMCSKKDETGAYCIPQKTAENAALLVRELMAKYRIPAEHVLRHYDVSGKACPAPWVEDPTLWSAFLASLTPKDKASSWAEEACAWAVAQGLFRGDGQGNFRWQEPVTREELAVILHRQKA